MVSFYRGAEFRDHKEDFAGMVGHDVMLSSAWLAPFGGQNMPSVQSRTQRSEKNLLPLTILVTSCAVPFCTNCQR